MLRGAKSAACVLKPGTQSPAAMDLLYEKFVRPRLFRMDSEEAHEWGVARMALLARLAPVRRVLEWWHRLSPSRFKPVEAFGLQFPNTVGLAAGFDKNAEAWPAAAALGFGHVEIGTVTALAQPGNEKPRMFRFPEQEAVINRMGFNNEGAEAVAQRLRNQTPRGQRSIPLGINLGKSKVAPLDEAVADYLQSFELLADHADYLVLNVSSPNTPGLRELQDESRLRELLAAISQANRARGQDRRPLLLKIAPDLTYPQIDDVIQVIADHGLDGIIATNTTLARPGFFADVNQAGGLSGAPLQDRSTQIINYVSRATGGRLPIIGVGGITDTISAGQKMDAGACLVQVYSGMIFRGPFFAAALAHALRSHQR